MSTIKPPAAGEKFTIVIPTALQAFSVWQNVRAESTGLQVLPLIPPNFSHIGHDLVEPVELSAEALLAQNNTRFMTFRKEIIRGDTQFFSIPRQERLGVYLSWCVPRTFRTGITATDDVKASAANAERSPYDDIRIRSGYSAQSSENEDDDDLQFRAAPDRWLIFRYNADVSDVKASDSGVSCIYLVESNRLRAGNDIDLNGEWIPDLATSTSPTIDPQRPMSEQRAMYIGKKFRLYDYTDIAKGLPEDYRYPFTVVQPGNEFFADYQPNNMSVFSFFDDLDAGTKFETKIGNVSYMVIGYHSQATDDPMCVVDAVAEGSMPTNRDILHALELEFDTSHPFMNNPADNRGRTVCHGIIRDVPCGTKAEFNIRYHTADLQKKIREAQPISVGLHALDALSAYLHVRLPEDEGARVVHQLLGQLISLVARDDDVDQQRKALDEAATSDWNAISGNTEWCLPAPESSNDPKQDLSSAEFAVLRQQLEKLNNLQLVYDTCMREYLQLLRRLFACWWNAVALCKIPGDLLPSRRQSVKATAQLTTQRLRTIIQTMTTAQSARDDQRLQVERQLSADKQLSKATSPPFGMHQDPTILIAGTTSGWPRGFNESLSVRLASQIGPSNRDLDQWDADIKRFSDQHDTGQPGWDTKRLRELLADIASPVMPLVREFIETDTTKRTWPQSSYQYMESTQGRFDQGWFPLYIEWELEYYHVPFNCWTLTPDSETGSWRYTIRENLKLANTKVGADLRTLKDRTTIVPQSGQSLSTRLTQLFDRAPRTLLEEHLSSKQKEDILAAANNMQYLSTPLGGFTDHLLTLRRGHHSRPSSNDPRILDALGVTASVLELLKESHDVAPYGMTTPVDQNSGFFSPFKPVTHGQARFTKLTIVDKFGQVVFGVDPPSAYYNTPPGALYPCISPALACSALPGGSADYFPNTAVKADEEPGLCQFFQIPPRINQEARLNHHFVRNTRAVDDTAILSEWDNPIWGWLMVNYLNESVQVFNAAGGFVAEVTIERTEGSVSLRSSLGPVDVYPPEHRLVDFVAAMKDETFTQNLFIMLAEAADNIESNPANYDGMLSAAFGRPFCLADVGFSIELAAPPLLNTSLLVQEGRLTEPSLLHYTFPVALGNHTAAYDGLVGTFARTGVINTIKTGYGLSEQISTPNQQATLEAPTEPMKLKPYYLPGDTPNLNTAHAQRLECTSCILDPVIPLHVYSGLLFPMLEVALPSWTTSLAMQNMQTFFRAGPILVPEVPSLGEVHIQAVEDRSAVQMGLGGQNPRDKVQWLAPWIDEAGTTHYDRIPLRGFDETLKVEAAEHTKVVDGFILVQPKTERA